MHRSEVWEVSVMVKEECKEVKVVRKEEGGGGGEK